MSTTAANSARKYKKRKKWNQDDMAAAVLAVRDSKRGYLKAAQIYNVPRTTLFRFAKEKETLLQDTLTKKIGRRPVFEDILVKYALVMEQKLYGLTRMDMRFNLQLKM